MEADVVVGAVVEAAEEEDIVELGVEEDDVEAFVEDAVVVEAGDDDLELPLLLTDAVAVPGTHW